VNSSTPKLFYEIPAGCKITLDFSGGDISCISFLLDDGTPGTPTTISVSNKKGTASISAFGSSGCPGSGNTLNRNFIYASPTSQYVSLSNGTTGCCSDTMITGSVYMPAGSISFRTNQTVEVTGQTTCGSWNVQSGNHPNPIVTYDPSNVPQLPEQLRLVE
jgi:hypothetical protein